MKLKEKMAKDIIRNIKSNKSLLKWKDAEQIWLMGFNAAKKMSLMPEYGYEGPFISGTNIEKLGEEEVK